MNTKQKDVLQNMKRALLKMTPEEWQILEDWYRHKDTRRGKRRYLYDEVYNPYKDNKDEE